MARLYMPEFEDQERKAIEYMRDHCESFPLGTCSERECFAEVRLWNGLNNEPHYCQVCREIRLMEAGARGRLS